MMIPPLTTYQTGLHAAGDFEVMRDSTAILFSHVPWKPRTLSVEIDGEIMLAMSDIRSRISHDDWIVLRDFMASEGGIGWKS